MNYLLHGPDTYRSRKKLREIVAAYRAKAATRGLNMHAFDASEDDLERFAAAAAGGTLFAAKKLIVLERPFSAPRQFDTVKGVLAGTHKKSDILLIVWDEVLDTEGKKRLKSTEKYFDKQQECSPLTGAQLARWIREEAAERGVSLSGAEQAALAERYGTDLWRMAQEVEKVAVGGGISGASRGARRQPTVFELGDTFFSSPREARRLLLSLLDAGEDERGMFAYLAGHARTLLIVKASMERGIAVPAAAKIHPFVAKKAGAAARSLPLARLVRILERFFEEDRKIKTGMSAARESLLQLLNI